MQDDLSSVQITLISEMTNSIVKKLGINHDAKHTTHPDLEPLMPIYTRILSEDSGLRGSEVMNLMMAYERYLSRCKLKEEHRILIQEGIDHVRGMVTGRINIVNSDTRAGELSLVIQLEKTRIPIVPDQTRSVERTVMEGYRPMSERHVSLLLKAQEAITQSNNKKKEKRNAYRAKPLPDKNIEDKHIKKFTAALKSCVELMRLEIVDLGNMHGHKRKIIRKCIQGHMPPKKTVNNMLDGMEEILRDLRYTPERTELIREWINYMRDLFRQPQSSEPDTQFDRLQSLAYRFEDEQFPYQDPRGQRGYSRY